MNYVTVQQLRKTLQERNKDLPDHYHFDFDQEKIFDENGREVTIEELLDER